MRRRCFLQCVPELALVLLSTTAHFAGPPIDLALHLIARVAHLAHEPAHAPGDVRDAFRPEEQQDEEEYEEELTTADIEEKRQHRGAKVASPAAGGACYWVEVVDQAEGWSFFLSKSATMELATKMDE